VFLTIMLFRFQYTMLLRLQKLLASSFYCAKLA
jgi:hypothetical protein